MPTVLAEKKARPPIPTMEEPLTDTRAEVVTPGGGVVLAITILLTLFLVLSILMPRLDGLQLVIVAMLSLVCWGYLLNCSTERLRLEGGFFEFRAFLGRGYKIPLEAIRGFKLTDLGVSLSGSMYLLDITVEDRLRPIQINLGPCWNKRNLLRFLKSFGQVLE